MKKVLGILVLGLLLVGCSTGADYAAQRNDNNQSTYLSKAISKTAKLESMGIERGLLVHSFFTGFDYAGVANMCAQKKKFYFHFFATTDLERANPSSMYYQIPLNRMVIYCSRENLTQDPVHDYNLTSFFGYQVLNKLESTNYNEAQKVAWDNGGIKPVEESKDLLANIKNTCMEFGYKEGTEKLADCMKDLYLKQTQPTTIVQGTTKTTKTKRRIDPSVWDDILDVSRGLGEGKSITESLGGVSSGSSKIQCFKTNERVSGTNKICSYNCMGSEVVQNIASTRICPMSIDIN